MANEGYHEPIEELSDETRNMHRAITSLMEELEAVDWYNQRMDACKDDEKRKEDDGFPENSMRGGHGWRSVSGSR